MIEFKTGNILKEEVDALVNTVNCVGVMGRGIALQFKKSYPHNFKQYEIACKRKEVQPGKMFAVRVSDLTKPNFIINFPTKRHWRGRSRIEDIESGLRALVNEIQKLQIKSIAIPPLGCGLGGLEWREVKPIIQSAFEGLDLEVIVFEPSSAPSSEEIVSTSPAPKMTSGRAALVGLMSRYLEGLLDPCVTLIEVHKLMYFMQEAGQPLKLNYTKGLYGPYATNLSHVLNHIEGYYVSGYADGGDSPGKELHLIPGAIEEAKTFLANEKETVEKFNRVAELVCGFESPFGMEILSSVHWVVSKENARESDEIFNAVHSWNERKKQFSARQIDIATNVLQKYSWI